ncbi:MAG: mechanosensitive ion channel family protein [Bacteroidales bacterium]|nr:mechanosensitive ion channel family protein [Bacteroidales bacterium]
MKENLSEIFSIIIILIGIVLISILANFVTKKIVLEIIRKIVKKTKSNWDDIILSRKVFDKISHIVPVLIIYYTIVVAFPESTLIVLIIRKICIIYLIILFYLIISSFLNAVDDIYKMTIGEKKGTSIKSFLQVIKILLAIVMVVLILSLVLNRELTYIIGGLGAMTAVLMLVFQDTILGFVGGVQLTANDMVRIGDWIEMPSRNADGNVVEVTLNTVKVQNWDKTISTIPTYALVKESFNNWRGMVESGGRRIKRSVNIDMKSIKFCSPELLDKLSKFYLLKDYISEKTVEIEAYNKKLNVSDDIVMNGRHLTNIGIFRKYLEEYLKHNEKINKDMTFLVRQLSPTAEGIPMEIYVFSNVTQWVGYEGVQSDIFDHVLAIIPEFELRVFQDPTGDDFRKALN